MKKAIFPGSFDPITHGHLDLIRRALAVFDNLIILIAQSPHKSNLFSVKERKSMILETCRDFPQITVDSTNGLLMDYASEHKAQAIIRGLRATSDFEYEFQMASMNKKLNPHVETFFIMTGEKYFYISSRAIKEVMSLGGDVSSFVPTIVNSALKKKYKKSK
ncbi:MAG: pantetheine-phosphate adenylyltransferase [Deltaproteobacteria bacterium]|nr:pantetheine-phosphate adenylyltransferase [Deltaproteobacteria bacterium]